METASGETQVADSDGRRDAAFWELCSQVATLQRVGARRACHGDPDVHAPYLGGTGALAGRGRRGTRGSCDLLPAGAGWLPALPSDHRPTDTEADEYRFRGRIVIARDLSNHDIRFGANPPGEYHGNCAPEAFEAQAWCVAAKASVLLVYEMPPREFELLIPGVNINDKNFIVPPIRFEYDDFPAYQFVPWVVNF